MNPGPAEQSGRTSTVSLADLAYVLVALQAIVMVIAGLCVAIAFCAVLLADLVVRAGVIELQAVELLARKVLFLKALIS